MSDKKKRRRLSAEKKWQIYQECQHRAAGLKNINNEFNIILTIFIDLDIIKSAEIFAKINSTQKSVNPSIAYQLFGYSDKRSPQKTIHDIAKQLHTNSKSPFYKKFRMLGTKDDWTRGSLSQATFANHAMKLFTRNVHKDEYDLMRGDKLEYYLNYPLRKHFIEKSDDIILKVIWMYFYQVANTWPGQWKDEKTSILPKTTGYIAFIEVLKRLMNRTNVDDFINTMTNQQIFSNIKNKYEKDGFRFIRDNYPPGASGSTDLRNQLLNDLSRY